MKSVERRLAEYRRKQGASCDNSKIPNRDKIHEVQSTTNGSIAFQSTTITKFVNILLKPVRLWFCFCHHCPRSSIIVALLSWLIAQLYFAYIEFGLVFFVSSLFVFLFINLGRRKSGELSAYSVFNPHCERLAGTMTAEHFERDLLKRKMFH